MFLHVFTAARLTVPHWPSVLRTLRQTDPSAGLSESLDSRLSVTIDKDTAWTTPQIDATQNVIENAPTNALQIRAQFDIDAMPIVTRALVLALLDQLNVIRAALPTPLPAITPAQVIAAIRNKAGTL